jgi:epoxyqueuosine reductase
VLTGDSIKARAREIGFDLCGICSVASFPELRFYREWIERGYAGDMAHLAQTAERRSDVRSVLPSARSVIVTATVYNVDRPYSMERRDLGEAAIARYAWGDDYHDVLGGRMNALLAWMREQHAEPFEARVCVDTGPVQERVYAQHAGLGWIGRNTCLINSKLGSWLFLAEIVCSLRLEGDSPAVDQCGSCTLCLEACPAGALVEPGVLDATRCVSYLTVERRGDIPDARRDAIGNHVYGCDLCQEVCPWNRAAARSGRPEWSPRPALDRPRLLELWRRTDAELSAVIRGSAMRRTRVAGLRRNLAVALGNSGDPSALRALDEPAIGDHTRRDQTVMTHVAWARRKLGG